MGYKWCGDCEYLYIEDWTKGFESKCLKGNKDKLESHVNDCKDRKVRSDKHDRLYNYLSNRITVEET